jgi:MFS transporter, ACS family, tartrate transporter
MLVRISVLADKHTPWIAGKLPGGRTKWGRIKLTTRQAMRKATFRLLPFLCLCYGVSFLDRVNVGFAALAMSADLGFTASVFGFGAGIFFVGYILFEVPSNLVLERVGARRWIARIMFPGG